MVEGSHRCLTGPCWLVIRPLAEVVRSVKGMTIESSYRSLIALHIPRRGMSSVNCQVSESQEQTQSDFVGGQLPWGQGRDRRQRSQQIMR